MKKRDIFINMIPFIGIICNYIFVWRMGLFGLSYIDMQIFLLLVFPLIFVFYDYRVSTNWKNLTVLYMIALVSQIAGCIIEGHLYYTQVSSDPLTPVAATAFVIFSAIYSIILDTIGVIVKKKQESKDL